MLYLVDVTLIGHKKALERPIRLIIGHFRAEGSYTLEIRTVSCDRGRKPSFSDTEIRDDEDKFDLRIIQLT